MENSDARFDRFDIVEANYLFCRDYHSGQGSYLYKRLCRIQRYFKPRISLYGYSNLTENGKLIYSGLRNTRFAYLLKNISNG